MLLILVGVLVIGGSIGGIIPKIYEAVTAVKVQDKVQRISELETIERIEFKRDELTTLQKEQDKWQNVKYSNLSYNQEAISSWVNQLLSAETVGVVKNVEVEADYGISETSPMITVFDDKGKSETYRIGNELINEDKMYVKKEEEDYLYIMPMQEENIFYVDARRWVEVKQKLQISDVKSLKFLDSNGKSYTVSNQKETWYLDGYYEMPCVIKQEAIETWFNAIKQMQLSQYIGTDVDLTVYGLDVPTYTMTINDQLTLLFGKQANNWVYVQIKGEPDVYAMDLAVYQSIVEKNYFQMIDKKVLHFALEEVDSILMTNPQNTFEFKNHLEAEQKEEQKVEKAPEEVTTVNKAEEVEGIAGDQEVKEQIDSEEESTEKPTDDKQLAPVTLNEKPLSLIEGKEWLNTIQESLEIVAELKNPEIEQKEERKAESQIICHLKTGEEIKIELIAYDINYYIMRYNNNIQFAVNKEKVIKLFTQLSAFLK